MDVADDVERAVIAAPVVPGPLTLEGGRLDLLDAVEHGDAVEALASQAPERPPELAALVAEDVHAEGAVCTRWRYARCRPFGHVEHDGGGEHVVLLGQADELTTRLGLHVRGVDDREPAGLEALAGDEVEHVEGRGGRGLVVLVVARRDRGRGPRTPPRSGRKCLAAKVDLPEPLAPTSTTSAELWDLTVDHRENTAICVGAPTSDPRPDAREHDGVPVALGHAGGPLGELGARPLEAVIAVAELARPASGSNRALYSRLGVVSTTVRGVAWWNTTRSKLGEAVRVEVLDDLDGDRRVEALDAAVPVGERAVEELDPLALAWGHGVQVEPARRRTRASGRRRRRPTTRSRWVSLSSVLDELAPSRSRSRRPVVRRRRRWRA